MRAVDVYMRLSPSRRWYQCPGCGELKQPGLCTCEEFRRYGYQASYRMRIFRCQVVSQNPNSEDYDKMMMECAEKGCRRCQEEVTDVLMLHERRCPVKRVLSAKCKCGARSSYAGQTRD